MAIYYYVEINSFYKVCLNNPDMFEVAHKNNRKAVIRNSERFKAVYF